jgi:ornithine cyclodeaminase/alanine dehydrogenase-like protein (mu-crystallin family)
MRMIGSEEIATCLPMRDAIDLMAEAFAMFTAGRCTVPPRMVTALPATDTTLICKPAYVEDMNRAGIKLLTQNDQNKRNLLPSIQGVMLLLEGDTGQFLALMDGPCVTALRTGAASGLATELLARKDADTLALFGCGAQGRTQLEAVCCVRDLKRVFVYNRNRATAQAFVAEMQGKYDLEIAIADNLKHLRDADIICTATPSTKPLFSREQIRSGVHINAIGSYKPEMQELSPAVIRDGRLFVDSITDCLRESGDIIKPLSDNVIGVDHVVGEIGSVVEGALKGRESDQDITIFKSVGIAIQDLIVADAVFRRMTKKEPTGTAMQ